MTTIDNWNNYDIWYYNIRSLVIPALPHQDLLHSHQ